MAIGRKPISSAVLHKREGSQSPSCARGAVPVGTRYGLFDGGTLRDGRRPGSRRYKAWDRNEGALVLAVPRVALIVCAVTVAAEVRYKSTCEAEYPA